MEYSLPLTFECLEQLKVSAEPGEMDMSDCEVVRGEFLGGRTPVTVTFRDNSIRFSLPAIKMMEASHVELLIDPLGGFMAVRKGKEDDSHSICWSVRKRGKTVKRIVNASGFINMIYDLFSWNRKLTYRINGVFMERDKEKVLLFDVRHTEMLIPKHYAAVKEYYGQKMPRGSIVAYKKEWVESFGDSYYGNCFLSPVNVFDDTEKWDIGCAGTVALEPKIKIRDREELKGDIDSIVEDINGSGNGDYGKENDECGNDGCGNDGSGDSKG